ncbi:class I SAM-dependent methyltransferase [Streptomyces varsoviensis]|uniref:class I SAM-dependent methyltransferase n=1 Tax=Streptomyces varsoviensis TaxID=67373 RepID=UPI0033C9DE55
MADSATAELNPLTPQRLFHMMAGFKATAVLRTGVSLGVFDAVADAPLTAAELAGRLGLAPRGARALTGALAGAGLLAEHDGGRYGLPPGGAELLVTTSPRYCGGIVDVACSTGEWTALGVLARTVREGGPLPGRDALGPGFDYWVDFATHTTFGTRRGAELLADALDPYLAETEAPRVLDAACGHGLFGYEIAARHPDARIVSQDWPEVLEVAEGHAKRQGVRDRVAYLPGDVERVDLGGPYDVVVVANLLFHLGAERAARLVERLAGLLAPGGRLAVVGFTAGDAPAVEQEHAHLLGLLMLSWTDGGEMHSTADYRAMLAGAGLTEADHHSRPGLPLSALIGRRPSAVSS